MNYVFTQQSLQQLIRNTCTRKVFHSLEFLLSGIFSYTYWCTLGTSFIYFFFFHFTYKLLTHSKHNFLTLFPCWLCYDCRLSHEDFCGLILTCECFSLLNLSDLQCFICVNMKGTMKAKGPYYSLPVPENSFSQRKQWDLF